MVSADLPKFQAQYYKYQKELLKRLMWTFPKWFYFKSGTLAEQSFRELNESPVHDNPNLEFIGGRPQIRQQRDRRFKQELRVPKPYSVSVTDGDNADGEKPVVGNSRVTEADNKNDTTSLERKLSRTLYLVVSQDNGKSWSFPTFACENAPLHQVAEEGLYHIGGKNINYFNVSPTPCYVHSSGNSKDFFIKLRILAGDFKATEKNLVHKWLTSEELGEHLSKGYFEEIKHLMSVV